MFYLRELAKLRGYTSCFVAVAVAARRQNYAAVGMSALEKDLL
jgi:hypothetical protein